jgi:hypothetical protein
MKSELLSVVAAVLIAGLLGNAAQASPITYELDVLFQGGGTASGTFDFDPTAGVLGTVSNVNLTSTLDNTPSGPIAPEVYLSGFHTLTVRSDGGGITAEGLIFQSADFSRLTFRQPIPPGFPLVTGPDLIPFLFGSLSSGDNITSNGDFDLVADVHVGTTPLPSAWTMMLTGMSLVGFLALASDRALRGKKKPRWSHNGAR